jgi:hypothetical protein
MESTDQETKGRRIATRVVMLFKRGVLIQGFFKGENLIDFNTGRMSPAIRRYIYI